MQFVILVFNPSAVQNIVGWKHRALLFQNAVEAVEHGLSLWLPQLRTCSKSSTVSAEDTAEVCMKHTVVHQCALLCRMWHLCLCRLYVYVRELTAYNYICQSFVQLEPHRLTLTKVSELS